MNSAAQELRSLNDEDLAKQLEEAYRQLFTLRFQVATRQTGQHRALRETKRKIARIKTVQRARNLDAIATEREG